MGAYQSPIEAPPFPARGDLGWVFPRFPPDNSGWQWTKNYQPTPKNMLINLPTRISRKQMGLALIIAIVVAEAIPMIARARSGENFQHFPPAPPSVIAQRNTIEVSPTGSVRTITAALQQATNNTIIQLAPGTYGPEETFPLNLKEGVILKGNEGGLGAGVVITGGGKHLSRTYSNQNVAIVAATNTEIIGVTVTNPNTRGTGIWVENADPIIRNSSFVSNNREGIFASGTAVPKIENNQFINNTGNGVTLVGQSSGQVRSNVFDNTGFGVTVGKEAAPLIVSNQIKNNRSGIMINDQARPTIQDNTIENNREYGIFVGKEAQPNFLNNIFRGNGQDVYDQKTAPPPPPLPPESNPSPPAP